MYNIRTALAVFLGLTTMMVAAPAATMDIESCRARLRASAPAHGVAVADFDRYTQNATLLVTTVSAARGQPEGRETWWDYIAKTVDDERVADGKAQLTASGELLQSLGARYGVDPEVLVAIFGIETNYGRQTGRTPVLDAWLTRACTETKPLWRSNVYASIKLLRDGIVPAEGFVGSWSGAFGMTQFIPTSFYELAVDGDGDGRIDLYGSLADAYASTANHLRKRQARWRQGVPAVIEVSVPAGVTAIPAISASPEREFWGENDRRSLAQWERAGVVRADGRSLMTMGEGTESLSARLFAPAGAKGPVFLATENFDALQHYNQSRKYGLAVSLLVERLRGGAAIVTPWPTDDPGLSRAEVRELQALLIARGHDPGAPDGIPGARTRDAVRAEQKALGLPQDGRVGMRILQRLREKPRSPEPVAAATPRLQ